MRGVPGNRHSYRDYLLTLLDPSTIFRSYGAGRIYWIFGIFFVCILNFRKKLKIPNRFAKGGKGQWSVVGGQWSEDGKGQRSDVGSQGSEKDSGLKYLGMNAFGKDRNFIG